MHYGQHAMNDVAHSAGQGVPHLIQPVDPLTDRIQKSLSEISSIIGGAEDDLSAVRNRLFGTRLVKGESDEPSPPANGADESIAQALTFVTFQAMSVRQLAAELNGRI